MIKNIKIDRDNNFYQLKVIKVDYMFYKNYSYIIIDKATNEAAVIDPAWDMRTISSVITQSNAKLTTILLTHSHYDHVNLVNPLLRLYNPQVYMSRQEIDYYNYRCSNLNPVQDLEIIKLGRTPITCILTPGHTAGGVSYLLTSDLFTGDTVFIEGCGICTSPGACPESMFNSFQKIKEIIKPNVRIYPGHSYGKEPGYTLSYLLNNNIYFQIDRKNLFVEFRMRKNQKNLFYFQ